jgi:hypothetical protein
MQARARSLGVHLHGLALLVLLAQMQACECNPTDPGGDTLYRIQGGDMGERYQNLHIYRDDLPVDDAAVTVNGVALPLTSSGFYQGKLPAFLPTGAPVDLEVHIGSAIVRATDSMPEVPVVTGPTTGSVFAPADAITVTWTSATTPDRFKVIARWAEGEDGASKGFPALATARSLQIPAKELPLGRDVTILVFAYNDGAFTGPADPASRMSIRRESYSSSVITVGTAQPR